LKSALRQATGTPSRPFPVPFPDAFEKEVSALGGYLSQNAPVADFLVRRLIIDLGGTTEKKLIAQAGPGLATELAAARTRLAAAGYPVPAVEARTRYAWIREKTTGCVSRGLPKHQDWTSKIDAVLTHR